MLLGHVTQKHSIDIKELTKEVRRLSDDLIMLTAEIDAIKQASCYERENLMLQLDNTLLQFERRLPPSAN